jgi:lipopolysaccharide cholinephosphotransferase
MDTAALEKLHLIEKEILDKFKEICQKHNLTYFITGGTMLGAVRHKGFIPWDDDVDVGMPREDYEKFVSLPENALGADYYILSNNLKETFTYCFAKLCKKNTFFIKKRMTHRSAWEGIHIDIFPYDNAPNSKIIMALQNFFFRRLQCIISSKIEKPRFPKHFIERFLSLFFSVKFLRKLQKKVVTLYNNTNTSRCVQWASGYSYKKETFSKDIISPTAKIEFEGSVYDCPANADIYLKQMYGAEYMQLPPVDKRAGANPLVRVIFQDDKYFNEEEGVAK